MRPMKILMVTPEMAPFAKVGGLGDVLQALPKALIEAGHDVRICIPLYGNIKPQSHWKVFENVEVRLGGHTRICRVWEMIDEGYPVVYFIEYNQYFERYEVYAGPWGAHFDNSERFTFLSRASLDLCYNLNWIPDVIHGHDWTTGLLPVYLNTVEYGKPLGKTATVFTVHNLEHHGVFDKNVLGFAGIPFSEFRADSLESMGSVNFMKGALYHSTKITTVSPTYAREIQTPEFGCGLHHVLKFKAADLIGILNGIDDKEWNPETDPYLPCNFSVRTLDGKRVCKETVQNHFGLPVLGDIPLFGVVSRFYAQKGLDVLISLLPNFLDNMKAQVVVLGTGEWGMEEGFRNLQRLYPNQLALCIGYNNQLAHWIEAGCDFFIMPSRFEPCGLNQMYSMRYGTLPIVRKTGGLADTVENYNEDTIQGTGFVFQDFTSKAIYNTLGWACATYYDRPDHYRQLQLNAMQKDFGWSRSASLYESVYKWAIDARKEVFSTEVSSVPNP